MKSWIREELGGVRFGDQRLDNRLLKLGDNLLEKPSLSLNQGQGDWATSKAAYRFLENEKVDVESIQQIHASRTCARISEYGRIVLAIQDTTTLDYSHFESIEGLSEIYRNQKKWKDSEGGQGLLVHSTFTVTADRLPLGLLNQKVFVHTKKEKKEITKINRLRKKRAFGGLNL